MIAFEKPLAPIDASALSFDVGADGVAVVTVDDAEGYAAAISPANSADLGALMDRIERDAAIRAVVLTSPRDGVFARGAGLDFLRSFKFGTDAERVARRFAQALGRVRKSPKPIVAAIFGPASSSGFELALACHAICAADDAQVIVALPEVELGLVPPGNGILRIAERAGIPTALALGVGGAHLRVDAAVRAGVVDEACPGCILLRVAREKALGLVDAPKPTRWEKSTELLATFAPKDLRDYALGNPLGRRLLLKKARDEARAQAHGMRPSRERAIDVLDLFVSKGFAAAAEEEARVFGELSVSETAHRLLDVALARDGKEREPPVRADLAEPVARAVVIGGGRLGSGIAHATLLAGARVRMKEKDDLAVGRGKKFVWDLLDDQTKSGALRSSEREALLARLTGTTDYTGLRSADLVVESVFEDLALKQSILRDVEAVTHPRCIYASNTLGIPIGRIAHASRRPELLVGMHYFAPVHAIPVVEVVRTEKTEPWVLATVTALGRKQGKLVIVVRDGVGYYTSRVLAPLLNEAVHMVSEGVPVEAIDAALVDWGFSCGPLGTLDEIGIDMAAHIAEMLHATFGDRLQVPAALERLVKEDRKGKKNGRGFYKHARGKGTEPATVDRTVYDALGIAPTAKFPIEEVQMRCALALVNEALRCLGDGVIESARDGDLAAIHALRFPAFRGGPFRYVDALGASEVLRRVQSYGDRLGARWTPAPMLEELARNGERIYPR